MKRVLVALLALSMLVGASFADDFDDAIVFAGLEAGYASFMEHEEIDLIDTNYDTFSEKLQHRGFQLNFLVGAQTIDTVEPKKITYTGEFDLGLQFRCLNMLDYDMDPDTGDTFAYSYNGSTLALLGIDDDTLMNFGIKMYLAPLGIGNKYFSITGGCYSIISLFFENVSGVMVVANSNEAVSADVSVNSIGVIWDVGLKARASVNLDKIRLSVFGELGGTFVGFQRETTKIAGEKDTENDFYGIRNKQTCIGASVCFLIS